MCWLVVEEKKIAFSKFNQISFLFVNILVNYLGCVPLLIQMIQAPDAREDSNINATENAIAAITKILQYNSSQVCFGKY